MVYVVCLLLYGKHARTTYGFDSHGLFPHTVQKEFSLTLIISDGDMKFAEGFIRNRV